MKRGIIVFFIGCAFFLSPSAVMASSQQAYQDYQYQFGIYRQKLTEYTTAITEYKKFNSLSTQQTALDAAKALVAQRDQAAKTYFLFLNEKLNENPGITFSESGTYRADITNHIAFFDQNSIDAASSQTLDEVNTFSGAFVKRYTDIQSSYRRTAVAIQMGYLTYFASKFDAGAAEAQALITAAKPQLSPEKQGTLDRWLVTLQNQHGLYQQKIQTISTIQGKILGDPAEQERQLTAAHKAIGEARQILAEGASFLKEVEMALQYE